MSVVWQSTGKQLLDESNMYCTSVTSCTQELVGVQMYCVYCVYGVQMSCVTAHQAYRLTVANTIKDDLHPVIILCRDPGVRLVSGVVRLVTRVV